MSEERDSRLLDAEVAGKVMGWHAHSFGNFPWQMQPPDKPLFLGVEQVRLVPHYSTDIAAAFEVVREMEKKGHQWAISMEPLYFVRFGMTEPELGDTSLPRAIVMAAIACVDSEESSDEQER